MWQRLTAGIAVLVVGGVALAGGFADASHDLPVLRPGETFESGRDDLTVHRAWVAQFRPDEDRAYDKPERRLFLELDVTSRGYESESLTDDHEAEGAPVALLDGVPRVFTETFDARTWKQLYDIHPGVPERVVVTLPWPAKVAVPEQVRLRFDRWTLGENNLLVEKVWRHEPGAYADVPVGPEPPRIKK
jgi:hypothetical protein